MVVLSNQKQTSFITVSQDPSSMQLDLSLSQCHACTLHLSLGLGKQTLELVENEAISLDNNIKEANGETCPRNDRSITKEENP